MGGEIGKQLNNNIKIFHENGYCFSLYCNTFYCKKDLVTYYRNFDKIERFLFDTLNLCRESLNSAVSTKHPNIDIIFHFRQKILKADISSEKYISVLV